MGDVVAGESPVATPGESTQEEAQHERGPAQVSRLIREALAKQAELSLTGKLSFETGVDRRTAVVGDRSRHLRTIATKLCFLKNRYLFAYQIGERKINRLLESMAAALDHGDHLVFALCTRALMEHDASISCLIERTKEVLDRLEDVSGFEPIDEGIEELLGLYQERLNSRRFFGRDGMVDLVSAVALIDQYLVPNVEDALEHYDYLSDFVHPGLDSNVLASGSGLGEGIGDPPMAEKRRVADNIVQTACAVIEHLDGTVEHFASLGMTIEAYLQKALEPTTRLEDLFVSPVARAGAQHGSRQTVTFFTQQGSVWLRLVDGTSFETPFRSIGDVAPEQEVIFHISNGKVWVSLDEDTAFETPLKSISARDSARVFTQEGRVWIRLSDGTAFETPIESIDDVVPEQKVTLVGRRGKTQVTLDNGASFESTVECAVSRQTASLFSQEGKVWLRLSDGNSFETPLASLEGATPEQTVTLYARRGKVWASLEDGTYFETPLESVSCRQRARFFSQEGKVWLRLSDGTSLETPFTSLEQVIPQQKVRLFTKQGSIWLTLGSGITFETPLTSLGRQVATFFNKEGKVWLRLKDGTSFETPLKSVGDVTPREEVMLFTKHGKIWLSLDRGISFETPLGQAPSGAVFFNKRGKVWLRT